MSPNEHVSVAQYVANVKNGEKAAIVSSRDSDSGGLTQPQSPQHIDGDLAEVSDLETGREAVEPCQFEPEVYSAKLYHDGQNVEYCGGEEILQDKSSAQSSTNPAVYN